MPSRLASIPIVTRRPTLQRQACMPIAFIFTSQRAASAKLGNCPRQSARQIPLACVAAFPIIPTMTMPPLRGENTPNPSQIAFCRAWETITRLKALEAVARCDCSQRGKRKWRRLNFKYRAKASAARSNIKPKPGRSRFSDRREKIKFVLQADNEGDATELTHYASGMVFGRLNPVKISRMVANGHHCRTSDRRAALKF